MITVFTSELPKALAESVADKPHKMYMYLEYATSGSAPTYTAGADVPNFADPKTYYSGLVSSKNYLRVPAITDPNVVQASSGSAPTVTYTTTTTFFGQSNSSSTAGVNPTGTSFVNNVVCYGAALVLAPDAQDPTKDLIIARGYFTDALLTKTSSSELFVTFPFTTSVIG